MKSVQFRADLGVFQDVFAQAYWLQSSRVTGKKVKEKQHRHASKDMPNASFGDALPVRNNPSIGRETASGAPDLRAKRRTSDGQAGGLQCIFSEY